MPEVGVLIGRDLSEDSQGLFVLSLMHEGHPDALLREPVGRVDGEGLLEFVDRVVEKPDVQIDQAEAVVRILETRVQRERAAELFDRRDVRESVRRAPQ